MCEIGIPDIGEAFQRVEFPGAASVAIGPLIVAGRIDRRGLEAVEVAKLREQHRVVAGCRAGLGVTDVDDELRAARVDRVNQDFEGRKNLGRFAVRHVAKRDEGEAVGFRGSNRKAETKSDGGSKA